VAVSEWEPATEAEAAMRDALGANDQEQYFRILARTDVILPVAADALAGNAPVGWGTWTTDSRTHVLAFTSSEALDACLAEHAGTFRQLPFHELAAAWPDLEWWLAVNPGLPIEGYLPAWFVAQISRGDVRLPGRTLGARARIEHVEALKSGTRGSAAAAPAKPPAERPVGLAAASGPADTFLPPGGRSLTRRGDLLTRRGFPRRGGAATGDSTPDHAGADPNGSQNGAMPATGTRPAVDNGPAGDIGFGAGIGFGADNGLAGEIGFAAGIGPAGDIGFADDLGPAADAEPTVRIAPSAGLAAHADAEAAVDVAPEPPAPGADASLLEQFDFTPANRVEEGLLDAAGEGSTDSFLSTLLLARVLVPGPQDDAIGNIHQWLTELIDGQPYVVVFTSPEMLARHLGEEVPATWTKFTQLIHAWPNESLSFAVNPGTPIGATLPGSQIVALASWADEVGLTDEQPEPEPPAAEPEPPRRSAPPAPSTGPVVMQKTIPSQQVPFYLDRGYDRISGFVHRASEIAHLRTPAELYAALGLSYSESPFKPDDAEVYVLRWAAHRGNLYRIPYGGQHEAAMNAMQGWMIERPPFRGNGFAPSDSRDVIAEFKVDSVRLPHGAELWRVDRDGEEKLIAMFDADGPRWQRVGEE
jgi:YD repeat-containing protein